MMIWRMVAEGFVYSITDRGMRGGYRTGRRGLGYEDGGNKICGLLGDLL